MSGRKSLRCQLREGPFIVVRGAVIPDRKALCRPTEDTRHQTRHDGRIEPAAQKHAERHIANEMGADTLFESLP